MNNHQHAKTWRAVEGRKTLPCGNPADPDWGTQQHRSNSITVKTNLCRPLDLSQDLEWLRLEGPLPLKLHGK